jgi:hypothetical protein
MLGRSVLSRLLRRRLGPASHRQFVGGQWEEVGRLQLDFLVARGLRPHHVFLDIACGALRGGVHFIPYLDAGNYLGVDREWPLIRRGLRRGLPRSLRTAKRPEFIVSDSFEFTRFSKVADISLAHSLFTHLVITDIERCCASLRGYVAPGHQFYATFWLGDSAGNRPQSRSLKPFRYSTEELAEIGRQTGWTPHYIGEWGHPRGQMMMRFTPR